VLVLFGAMEIPPLWPSPLLRVQIAVFFTGRLSFSFARTFLFLSMLGARLGILPLSHFNRFCPPTKWVFELWPGHISRPVRMSFLGVQCSFFDILFFPMCFPDQQAFATDWSERMSVLSSVLGDFPPLFSNSVGPSDAWLLLALPPCKKSSLFSSAAVQTNNLPHLDFAFLSTFFPLRHLHSRSRLLYIISDPASFNGISEIYGACRLGTFPPSPPLCLSAGGLCKPIRASPPSSTSCWRRHPHRFFSPFANAHFLLPRHAGSSFCCSPRILPLPPWAPSHRRFCR